MGDVSDIDASKLSHEMARAVESDRRRKEVDDMKKRSVMTARSYDEFRHLVACAQDGQKPMSSKEFKFVGEPGKREGYMNAALRNKGEWHTRTKYGSSTKELLARAKATQQQRAKKEETTSNNNDAEAPGSATAEGEQAMRQALVVPKTRADFHRQWRRNDLNATARFDMLVKLDPTVIFKLELDELGQLVQAFLQGLAEPQMKTKENMQATAEFLVKLSGVGPFEFAKKFLTASEKQDIGTLVDLLKQQQAPSSPGSPASDEEQHSVLEKLEKVFIGDKS